MVKAEASIIKYIISSKICIRVKVHTCNSHRQCPDHRLKVVIISSITILLTHTIQTISTSRIVLFIYHFVLTIFRCLR